MSDYWGQPMVLKPYVNLVTPCPHWAVFAQREAEGRCGNCGAFQGPTHRCPPRLASRLKEED